MSTYSASSQATYSAQVRGPWRYNVAGQGSSNAEGLSVAPTPVTTTQRGDETVFALDLAQGRTITLRDKAIEIVEANASGVRFVVR